MPVRTLPLALVILFVLLPQGAAAATGSRIIVKRDAGLSAAERADIRADADVRFVESLELPRTELVAVAAGDVKDAVRDLNRDPDVEYAQIDHRRQASYTLRRELWALHNTAQEVFPGVPSSSGLLDADIDAPAAWDQQAAGVDVTGTGQIVAVVDTGIWSGHPDLQGRIAEERDFVGPGPEKLTAPDGDGHGTHVSGTIAALRDNSLGFAGVAPGSQIMALKALADNGGGSDSDIAEAFRYAGLNGAHVVNASLGGAAASPVLADAINMSPDTLFVVAAGNDGTDNDVAPQYPCNLDDELNQDNVLCVGASTNRDRRAGFSNYGDVNVDLFAPGDSIASTFSPHDGQNFQYAFMSGTSMAAPHVAATAALMLQAAPPGFSAADVKDALLQSVDVKSAFQGLSVSGGRLNAAVAVARALGSGAAPADGDGDGAADVVDDCPAEPAQGLPNGCPNPDSDGDTRLDTQDNCREDPNQPQTDADGDGLGDVCDPTPTGPGTGGGGNPAPPTTPPAPLPLNSDGDGFLDASDACPYEGAFTANGCPVPSLTGLSGKVKKRGTRRYVVVRASTTRAATVRLLVQRKAGRRWVKVKKRTLATRGNRIALTVNWLRRGRHRVVAAVYSSAGAGPPATRYFTVR